MEPTRRDARARRAALIAAAAESFAESGYGVPLEDVATRAGVGRGTLYRNFRDREALALAIFDREIDLIAEVAARDTDLRTTLVELVRAGARGAALYARIGAEIAADTENRAALEALGERLAAALEPLATRAHHRGELREGIDGRRLALALRMVGGLLRRSPAGDDRAARDLDDALDLLLEGLHP